MSREEIKTYPLNLDMKLYGTLYNYKGYGLDANDYDGACVPRPLLETYTNQDVTNPRNKNTKLIMPKLLKC